LPFGLALICIALAIIVHKSKPGFSRSLVSISFLILLVFSLPVTSHRLISGLENRHPALHPDDAPTADFIVLLGGGLNPAIPPRLYAQLGPSGDRLLMAYKLYSAGKAKRILIVSGNHTKGIPNEAEETALILQSWGVPNDSIARITDSINTEKNASQTKQFLDQYGSPSVLLVTTASHMLRAMALFRASGIDATPVPANHWVGLKPDYGPTAWIPNALNLAGSTRVLREYMGVLFYWLTGRVTSSDIFPDD